MGAAASQCSCISVNDSEDVRTSKSIDHSLRETRRQRENTPKILLLGSGESGKSTVLKQMRLINNIPFTENEREAYRVQIFYNLVNGMRSLLDALRDLPPLETDEASQATQNPIHQVPVHSHAYHRPGIVSHNPPPPVFPNTNVKPRKPLFGPVPPLSPSPTPPESTDSLASDEADRESTGRISVVKEVVLPASSPVEPPKEPDTKEDEEPRSRSPSISLNLFASGSLTPRQLSLLHELNYPPDLRPGQPFPIEFEAILRECWWGLTPDEYAALFDQHRRQGTSSEMKLSPKLPGAGAQLDRIAVESGVAIPDNLPYLFRSPQRLSSFFHPDYMPTDEDILRCRGRTTGIQETIFQLGKDLGGALKAGAGQPATSSNKSNQLQPLKIAVGKTKLHLVDVGGQKSERRKWIHCFEGVTAVLFLVGLSGYNQGLIEDSTANQMQDAMSLWDGVCSSQWFKSTALILFLNKTDLFAEKVAKFPIRTWFTDFDGEDGDVDAGLQYFRKRFLRIAVKATRNMNNNAANAKKSGTHEPLSSRTKSKTRSGNFSNPLDSKDTIRKRSSQRADSSPTATMGTAGTTTMSSYGQATLTPSTVPTLSSSPNSKDKGKGRAMGEALEMGERPSPTAVSSRSRSAADERERERKEAARTVRPRRDSVGRNATLDSTGGRGMPKGFIGMSSLPKNPTGGSAVGKGRFVYTHFTNATDTDHLRVVILAVCDIILRDNFATAHLI